MFTVDQANACDFFEVYKNVVPEYQGMVEALILGPCIAMNIRSPQNALESFRAVCGPSDPELARILRPTTLRALYGDNKVCNPFPQKFCQVELFLITLFDRCCRSKMQYTAQT